jgi:serine/threonine protein kinase
LYFIFGAYWICVMIVQQTYLHSREPPILHLDLKSANILVDNSWKVKLGDFGLSQIRTNTFMSSAASAGGTPQWMAPEVLRSERYGEAADVYSFGVVLWEVITGKAPWEDMHPMQVVGAVGFQGRMLPMPTDPEADPALVEMAMWCMNHNPARRPTFRTIVDALDAKFNHQPHEPNSETLTDHVKVCTDE